MEQKDKELLFKDLCARLPYGVVVELDEKFGFNKGTRVLVKELLDLYCVEGMKPYLRPMLSMTEEEKNNLQSLHDIISDENYEDGYSPSAWNAITKWEDYCNARHLDYRGLIEKGLALEAKEGMYNKV